MVLTSQQLGVAHYLVKEKNYSAAAAAREIGVSPTTVRKYAKRNFEWRKRCGVETVKTKKRRQVLLQIVKKMCNKENRVYPAHGSSSCIRKALYEKTKEILSARQIRRCLRSSGLRCYRRRGVPTRGAKEVKARKVFAKRMLKQTKATLNSIVFSDETWLCCNEGTGAVQWAACRDDVQPLERKARWNVPSVMVWAAVGVGYKSPLIVFPPKKVNEDGDLRTFRLDAKSYIRRCLQLVVPDLVKKKKLFQQDGARSHASKHVHAYLQRKGARWIEDWPPYSPDMNMIEPLWKTLAAAVGRQCPLTMDELLAAAKKAWEELPQQMVDDHVLHFRKVCARVATAL